jgi:hypothetical protein
MIAKKLKDERSTERTSVHSNSCSPRSRQCESQKSFAKNITNIKSMLFVLRSEVALCAVISNRIVLVGGAGNASNTNSLARVETHVLRLPATVRKREPLPRSTSPAIRSNILETPTVSTK